MLIIPRTKAPILGAIKELKDRTNEDLTMIVVEKNVEQIKTGRCWAAVNNDYVVAVVSMRAPKNIEMDTYRTHAIEALSVLGEVHSGEIINSDGERVFCKRLTHKNRSKNPQVVRTPKMYRFFEGGHQQGQMN